MLNMTKYFNVSVIITSCYRFSAAMNYFVCGFSSVLARHEYLTDRLICRRLACIYKQTHPQLVPKK